MEKPPSWLKRLLEALAKISELISRSVDLMWRELPRIAIELFHACFKLLMLVYVIWLLYVEVEHQIMPLVSRLWA